MEGTDCGPAALTITLNYYAHPMTLDAAKAATHFHSDGTTALDLVNAAEASGLGAAGIAVDADAALPLLSTGDILHFDFNHFVVVETLDGDVVRLMDPAAGRVSFDRTAFARHYSGVALLFERSPEAMAARARSIGLSPPP